MTLIACTIKSSIPLIIADVLVSDDVERGIQMPTNVIDVNAYLTSHRKPTSLNQKAYIIKDNVCIALAGNLNEITRFLKEFKIRCSYYDNIGETEIKKFIEEYDCQNDFSRSACFILVTQEIEGEGIKVGQFYYPPNEWGLEYEGIFDSAYACGSGKSDFLHWTKAISVNLNNQEDPILQTVSLNCCYVARLLATERISLQTIKKHWGGAFEMILFNGKSFVKIDEIAFVIFHAYFDNNGNISNLIPGLVLYYKYQNDILFVSAIEVSEFEQSVDNGITTFRSKYGKANLFPILPIDRNEPCSENELPKEFSFQTNRIGVGFTFITEKVISPASYFVEDKETSVIYKDNDSIQISLKTEMNEVIVNAAIAIYPNL